MHPSEPVPIAGRRAALALAVRLRGARSGLAWTERARLEGGADLLDSPPGLAGEPVFGTMLAAAPGVDAGLVAECRTEQPGAGAGAVTGLPGVLVARFLGASSAAARAYFARLRAIVRPALTGRAVPSPAILQA